MTGHSTCSFQVLDGEVAAGVDPMVVPVETAAGQCELLRVDQLAGWFRIGGDGVARPLRRGSTRQHSRPALRRVRTAVRGQHTLCTLQGSP
jgi:hypothetical protein